MFFVSENSHKGLKRRSPAVLLFSVIVLFSAVTVTEAGSASWRGDENMPVYLLPGENIRLRIQADNQGNVSETAKLQLEYRRSSGGPDDWQKVPVDGDCSTAEEEYSFRICRSEHIPSGGTSTTARLSGISGSEFHPGWLLDDANPAPELTLEPDHYTELEWSLQATEAGSLAEPYLFRLSDTGSSLGVYSSDRPELQVVSSNPVLSQERFRWYENNDQLTPDTDWSGLGENTAITSSDDPPKPGDVLRLRMGLKSDLGNVSAEQKKFRLQYVERSGSSCPDPDNESWQEVGKKGSSTPWRGASVGPSDGTPLSGDPPTEGDLLLTGSDRAGTLEHENDSSSNPYQISEGEQVEYDWVLENHQAEAGTSYCFQMISDDGSSLDGSYTEQPVLTTADFTPESLGWRWYDDHHNSTPTDPLAEENSAPANISYDQEVKLRTVVEEAAGVEGENTKFRLEFSADSSFNSTSSPVEEIGSCEEGESGFCYTTGGGQDGEIIDQALLSDADPCQDGTGDGCGTHNESGTTTSDFAHPAGAAVEYEFTLRQAGALAHTTYYFRLVDAENGEPVPASEGESYPSVSTEGARLDFTVSGVNSGQQINSEITTDIATTPGFVSYGSLPLEERVDAAHRKKVSTSAPGGFQLLMYTRSSLRAAGGDEFQPIAGSNSTPVSWSEGCADRASCYGYHVGDDSLKGGSARFAPADSFAAFSEEPAEVGFSSIPVTDYEVDTVMSVETGPTQPAGDYVMTLNYLAVPSF